jgi:hypothetical protein
MINARGYVQFVESFEGSVSEISASLWDEGVTTWPRRPAATS